jgi:hypothetical protein
VFDEARVCENNENNSNEHVKFDNSCAMASDPDFDIEELRRENQLLKEKLSAIQMQQEPSAPPLEPCSSKPPRASNNSKKSASTEDLTADSREKITRGRSASGSNRHNKYWQWYNSPDMPCDYNPYCYSGNGYMEDEYLADMLYRYPDYFSRNNYYHHPKSARARAKSYDDLNRILEVNAMYDSSYPRRWHPRTRSMEGGRLILFGVAATPGMVAPSVWDPYFTSWKYSGGPRIPFRPRSVWDLSVGMKVSMHRSDGRLSRGTIRWIGLLPNLVGEYVGVELETQTGRHDGYLNGIRYFKCKEKCGIFVKFSKIIMVWR